ncbi:hypothetical protein ACMFMG_010349 [Clarireedia jacksonii]
MTFSTAVAAIANAIWNGPRYSNVYEIRAYLSTVAGITCTNMYTKRSGKCAILCDTLLRSLKGVFGSSMGASEPGLVDFVNAVSSSVGNVTDFYLYYCISGLGHCWGGSGGQPESLFSQLQSWAGSGTAPVASSVQAILADGSTRLEIICPYAQRAIFQSNCADATSSSSLDGWSRNRVVFR